MRSLSDILDDKYLVLHMRNLPVFHRENAKNELGSIWYTIDSTLREKEISTSWRSSPEHTMRLREDIDFYLVRFTESHSSHGTKSSAHNMPTSGMEIIHHTCAPQMNTKDLKPVRYCNWIATVRTTPWNNTKTTPTPSRLKIVCSENLEEQTQKYIPANKYGQERINRSQDPVKEPNQLIRKPDGNGILLPPHQVHLRHGGNQQIDGGKHRTDGGCEHYTTPAHIPHFRRREFSRVAQDLSRQVSSECLCLDKTTIFASGTQCRTRSHCCFLTWRLLHISLALQHQPPYCALHMEMTTVRIHDPERRLADRLKRALLLPTFSTCSWWFCHWRSMWVFVFLPFMGIPIGFT